MLEALMGYSGTGEQTESLVRELEAHLAAVSRSAGKGDRRQVSRVEESVRADPARAFRFDASGGATLRAAGGTWSAGHFEVVSIGELRRRAAERASQGRLRLWVMDGVSPATDIGALQAHSPTDAVFQVASQFNCLEASGPWIRPVEAYFNDPTQGPRASISAFPGTLLRHYRAPAASNAVQGRFVQTEGGPQIELLAAVCDPRFAQVRNGHLLSDGIPDPRAFVAALRSGFDAIRVGVHADLDVVLGYDWDGGVDNPGVRAEEAAGS